MKYARFWLARHLIHVGLWIMPEGPAKLGLSNTLWAWGDHVRRTVALDRLYGNRK